MKEDKCGKEVVIEDGLGQELKCQSGDTEEHQNGTESSGRLN